MEHNKQEKDNRGLPEWFGNYSRPKNFSAGKYSFPLGERTLVMGILNLTPDSFFPDSRIGRIDFALERAEKMLQLGADIIDIGGESTRPGSKPLPEEEEMDRVMPVVEQISRNLDCPISIDTYKSKVADAALKAGACIVNDIMGLQKDRDLPAVVAAHKSGVIIMHNARLYREETASEMLTRTEKPGEGIIDMMLRFIRHSLSIASRAGLQAEQIVLDPGIGFGVSAAESIQILSEIKALLSFNLPVLIGPSRKRFIGHITNKPVEQRLHGTSAAVALSIANGADMVRVHDVAEQIDVVRVADAICRRGKS